LFTNKIGPCFSSPDRLEGNTALHDDRLPISELTLLVRDLQAPRAGIFWTDLVCCMLTVQIGLYLSAPFPDAFVRSFPIAMTGFVLAVLALYRASYFNHELAHHARRLPGFEIAWNLGVGIPLLIPSFLYSDHRNHHSDHSFGTDSDAEYLPPGLRNMRGAAALLALAFLLPLIYLVRFAVLAPAAWLVPAVRQWVDVRASGIGLLGLSRRVPPTDSERPIWRVQEAACFCYLVAIAAGLLIGLIPIELAFQFYSITATMLVLHGFRIMAGHRYASKGGVHNRLEQVLDSFNFTHNRPLTWLLVPLGFHLHALHHLFPNIPYHNLPEAHRRIAAALPSNSIYHTVESTSYFAELACFMLRGRERDQTKLGHRAR
jgi:fatty acid desaturase